MRLPVSPWPETYSCFSAGMMKSVKVFSSHLLRLYLIFFFKYQTESCSDAGSPPLKPTIHHLEAVSDKQILVVSWLRNHGASEMTDDMYEIQISRTESYNIIYSGNVSVSARDSNKYLWTWISDLPLECVDHSVRIRSFCNRTVPSPWSNWKTNYGATIQHKTKIFPSNRMLREGSSAMFCCVPPAGVNITKITFKNKPYPLLSIGAQVKAISVNNLTIPTIRFKLVSVTCFEPTGKITYTPYNISFPAQKPTNLSCATSDMKSVTCTWDSGRKRDRFDRNKLKHTLYIQNSDQAPITCEASSCTFPAVEQLQEYNILVVVKDLLGEESETYNFNISDRVLPVLEMDKDTVHQGVTDVVLSWSVRGNLNLFCQVQTIPGSITELICNSGSDRCKVKLEHLQPNTLYSTKMRCSVNGRLWGKWTNATLFTTYPLVTLDVWRRIQPVSDSDGRCVTLLWSPEVVGGEAKPVNIRGYKLDWSQGEETLTELMDSGRNQAVIFIGPGRCDVTVQAVLQSGSSIPANITVPPKGITNFPPSKRRLSSISTGGFNLLWDQRSTVTCGYTVEWCILGIPEPCTLRWIKVPEGNNTLFLPARLFKPGRRYLFNIYGCSEHGDTLLEIQTGYSQELKYVQSPSLLKSVQITSSSVTLEWLYEDDPAQPAFVTGYLVTVQAVGYGTWPNLTENLFNVSVVDPRQKSVTIEGLQQQQEYSCSVSAVTKEGPGLPASITIRTRTNYLSHLVKILPPVLLLLGCIILMWPQRKILKNGLKEIFMYPDGMNIKTPEIDSFLNETDQKLQNQKVEECVSCDIEILNLKPLLHETATRRDPDFTNALYSPGTQFPPPSVPLQTNYCPQSTGLLCDRLTHQQMTGVSNRSYLSIIENSSEPQGVTHSDITCSFEPSDCLQEPCVVLCGYI